MIVLSIEKIIDSVAIIAQEYPIKKANLFGSYANGNNTPESDVDILVEFTTPRVSLLTLKSLHTQEVTGSSPAVSTTAT